MWMAHKGPWIVVFGRHPWMRRCVFVRLRFPFVCCSLRHVPRILAGPRAGRSRDGATTTKLELVTNL